MKPVSYTHLIGLCHLNLKDRVWSSLIVGNIILRVLSDRRLNPVPAGGIVGHKLPKTVHVVEWPYCQGDTLISVSYTHLDVYKRQVQVQWLNAAGVVIGIGLSLFVPSATSGMQLYWLTYEDVTETAPASATAARILFSKAAGTENDICLLYTSRCV